MAFFCGTIFKTSLKKFKLFLSTMVGSLVYIVLHELKLFIFNKYIFNFNVELNLILISKSLLISIFNAVLFISFSIIIYKFLHSKIPDFD